MTLCNLCNMTLHNQYNLKMQEMCNEATWIEPYSLEFVPNHLEIDPFILWYVPDNLKMQGMCIRAVEAGLTLLEYVPDWFGTRGQTNL